MKRRFLQFSLRGLLGLAALVCLLLGGRHLLDRLDVEEARAGNPIRVKARYFWLFGPRECHLHLGYEGVDGSEIDDGILAVYWCDDVKRSWWCLYMLERDLDPVGRRGQLVVRLKWCETSPGQEHVGEWMMQEKIVDVK